MDDVIGINPQSLGTIYEETLKGLRPIKGNLILFPVMNRSYDLPDSHNMIHTLGNEYKVNDI